MCYSRESAAIRLPWGDLSIGGPLLYRRDGLSMCLENGTKVTSQKTCNRLVFHFHMPSLSPEGNCFVLILA